MVIDQPACGDENWDEWVPLSDVLAAAAKSESDVIAGRTFGEDQIRAAYRAPRQPSGIVKLFENGCGAVYVSGLGGEVMADCVFQTAAAVMIWFQTAKRLVISVRHWGALIR